MPLRWRDGKRDAIDPAGLAIGVRGLRRALEISMPDAARSNFHHPSAYLAAAAGPVDAGIAHEAPQEQETKHGTVIVGDVLFAQDPAKTSLFRLAGQQVLANLSNALVFPTQAKDLDQTAKPVEGLEDVVVAHLPGSFAVCPGSLRLLLAAENGIQFHMHGWMSRSLIEPNGRT